MSNDMPEPLGDDNLADHLTALADGELDPARRLAVWTYLAEHPDRLSAVKWLRDQQRLTAVAPAALDATTPTDLHARIADLIGRDGADLKAAPEARPASSPAHGHGIGRRAALAIAAGLVLAVTAGLVLWPQRPTGTVLPPELILNVGRIHGDCARLPEDRHDADFEATDPALAAAVKKAFGGTTGVPDLSAAEFRIIGAGPCPASRFQTVHLLYRSTRPRSLAAVSLFVQADAGQFGRLEPGRVYRVSSATSPFPMLAWRGDGVVTFLLADNSGIESAVLRRLRPTPADAIVDVSAG